MKCEIKFKDISLYLDGRYSQKKREALQVHIADCPRCSKKVDEIKTLRASLTRLVPIEESSGFDFEFNRSLDERLRYRKEHDWKAKIQGAASNIMDSIVMPMPAIVKVAASFILVFSLAWSIRAQALQKMPFIEFSAGEARIYRQATNNWIATRPKMRLKAGDKIKLSAGAVVNIASKGRYKARIKDESLIVLSKLNSGLRNIDTDFSISYGKLLVNTTDKFKGSSMRIYTPACDAEVVGTAFIVEVFQNRTWLGVLEGRVRLLSKVHPLKAGSVKRLSTYVSAGQEASTMPYLYSTVPKLLSNREWKTMLELYQLVEKPQVMLLLGTGPNRVDEFLERPIPVYIPDAVRRVTPKELLEAIDIVKQATREGNIELVKKNTLRLQGLLERYPSPQYSVEILMFIASQLYYVHDYIAALEVLEKVSAQYPDSEFASLAQCSIATIYQNNFKDIDKARMIYSQLITTYPGSADAIRAKEMLSPQR